MSDELFARFRKMRRRQRASPSRRSRSSEANFADDLDADSLDLVELVMALEEEFDITVAEDELEGVDDRRPGVRPGRRKV